MNLASVLMCWNIPRISEDLLYELFVNAGPIEEISLSKNGKSCFVVYEHPDAVVTAKDIFKDVQLDGRPLSLFDHEEITKIHSLQEEQIAQNRNSNYECNPQNFSKSYESPYHDRRAYSNFHRNGPDYRGNERYSDASRGNLPHNYESPSSRLKVESNHRDWRANSMRNAASYASYGSVQGRSDLLPTSSPSSKAPTFDANVTFQDLLNGSSNLIDMMNPYNMPVSRSSQEIQHHFPNRSTQPDYQYNADVPGHYRHERRSRGEEFDHNGVHDNSANYDARYQHRNKYDRNQSGAHRNHPYREHQADHYKSRNSHPGERDHKYREQQKHRRRH